MSSIEKLVEILLLSVVKVSEGRKHLMGHTVLLAAENRTNQNEYHRYVEFTSSCIWWK